MAISGQIRVSRSLGTVSHDGRKSGWHSSGSRAALHPAAQANRDRDPPLHVNPGPWKKPGAPQIVLALLCLLYLILFVNRVNIATAAPFMKADLNLSNTQLGLVFSAFAVPYALFQLAGGGLETSSEPD
jgi:hypothetical protein